jgi:hypothetical protein
VCIVEEREFTGGRKSPPLRSVKYIVDFSPVSGQSLPHEGKDALQAQSRE